MNLKSFKRVLVANRGEIAVRVIRACREAGIESVAIYSDADVHSKHVAFADYSFHVGPAPSSESYLRADYILQEALKFGCDAVHPGYGFLSENAGFARAVMDAGMVWIGPPPDAIDDMGSKTRARQVMKAAGVPVVPGTVDPCSSEEEALQIAGEVGYPIMLKAAMGGGGKGMRRIDNAEELPNALRAAQSEASKSFGDDSVYIEKLVENPRHVEIQVLADGHGAVVHLFERDCSIQRRHQKVVEEAPCPVLPEETRQAMAAAACDAARAVDYVGAGTVEFLLGGDGAFYFLEMNTRLQVEHPITEMITGVDLVQAQFRVASGEPLWFEQESLRVNGHSIECRIYAEDIRHQFRPAPGYIHDYQEPQGPFVRVDSGVGRETEVPIHYDPMVAKLVVWGNDRQEAIRRCRRALEEFLIVGIPTTIPLFHAILDDARFQGGEYDTSFLSPSWLEDNVESGTDVDAALLAFVALLKEHNVHAAGASTASIGATRGSAWKSHLGWKVTRR